MKLGNILITGGAGYIGSHVVKALLETTKNHTAPHELIVLDNLSTGFQNAVGTARFVKGNIQDTHLVKNLITKENIQTIIHLAASTIISESIVDPLKYYENNAFGTYALLRACHGTNVKYFIYSSTAAVYATSEQFNQNIPENALTSPCNPYGHSKLMGEQMIKDFAKTSALRYIIFRYFNVAGADPECLIGQRTPQTTHLIKVAVRTACGLYPRLPIYGSSYPTADGTCIRDFIHVTDLAHAHLLALEYLQSEGKSMILNCGYGKGFSVKEVIQAVESITQKPLSTFIAPPRKGDVASVIADNTAIKQTLRWDPQFADLSYIVKTALDWELSIT